MYKKRGGGSVRVTILPLDTMACRAAVSTMIAKGCIVA